MKRRSRAGQLCRFGLATTCCGAVALATSAATPAQTSRFATTTVTSPTTAPAAAAKATHAVNLRATLRIRPQGAAFVGTGPATGTPFGAGRVRLRSTITRRSPLRTSSTLTVVTMKGNAIFKGNGRYVGRTFTLTMRALSGAGRYRGITGSNLAVKSVNTNGVDRLRMGGTVRYGPAAQTAP